MRFPTLVSTFILLAVPAAAGGAERHPAAAMEQALAAAERALAERETQIAESNYREAVLEGWLLVGALALADGDDAGARSAFESALVSSSATRRAMSALALTELRLGEAASAVARLREVLAGHPGDVGARRLLAQALIAGGRPEEAVQELEEAHALTPDDAETAFNLASGHLRLGQSERTAELFDRVLAELPRAETHVLVGRTYRDFKEFERARSALERALELDPSVRRARYYLGTVELLAAGRDGLDAAIRHFDAELALHPEDPMTHLYLGTALTEQRRFEEALAVLEVAARWPPARLNALRFMGRCQLGLDRAEDAASTLERALEHAAGVSAGDRQLSTLHYQLGVALRRLGREDAAAGHFEAAKSRSSDQVEDERERFARFVGETLGAEQPPEAFSSVGETARLAGLDSEQLAELGARVRRELARAYLNLGVIKTHRRQFDRAAELLARAAAVDDAFPGVQRALGVALFNAGRFAESTAPLAGAVDDQPYNADVRRTLALAWLNVEAYDKAAALLADDPERRANPSLGYAYGLALVRSRRAAEARAVFDRLLSENAEWAELHVLLGQAHAQDGDYDQAVAALTRALELDAGVLEAHATLGSIYLRRGELDAAEEALAAELALAPGDQRSRYLLATVLDLNRKPDEARRLLESVLRHVPDFADARYLLGKILLAQGSAEAAVAQLEAASEQAPEDANIRYQLAQALQRLGRTELAREQFEVYRRLKGRQPEAGG